jgi:peroxiredoxin
MLFAAWLVVACSGCQDMAEPDQTPRQTSENGTEQAPPEQRSTTTQTPDDEDVLPLVELPPPAEIPDVKLPVYLEETCLVRVGDPMPEFQLADVQGKEYSLDQLRGEKLTIVFFWTGQDLHALAELRDLAAAEPYYEHGVRVIGINEGDSPEAAAQDIKESGAQFVNLLDPNRTYFEQVATERLPRTYLLDPAGRILWFDTEYSPSTRRDLSRAIEVTLGEEPENPPEDSSS